MWDFIINPFTTLMVFLYSILGNNIVLAIIAITVLIRVLTYPLIMQQQRSTKAMQELQPKLKKLQEKYKNDREKLAQAQMELYREAGVNPFGGCLPLIIQLPVLLALYQAIIHSLSGSPFQLIDLSGRLLIPGLDSLVPLNNIWLGANLTLPPGNNPTWAMALPLIVAGTTWLQTKMTMPSTPTNGSGQPDQAQQMTRSMTTIMPIMFGFFALSFSVGISIYFITSNLIGIGQYWVMNRNKTAAASSGTGGSEVADGEKPKNDEFGTWDGGLESGEKPKRASSKRKTTKRTAKAK